MSDILLVVYRTFLLLCIVIGSAAIVMFIKEHPRRSLTNTKGK